VCSVVCKRVMNRENRSVLNRGITGDECRVYRSVFSRELTGDE
jgi:hypothetical protein